MRRVFMGIYLPGPYVAQTSSTPRFGATVQRKWPAKMGQVTGALPRK